jgi:hypothetical protein
VSFDILLLRFAAGEAARAEPADVLGLLEPRVALRGDDFVRIATSDGEADVYGIDDPGTGLIVDHASGKEIWSLLFELAIAAGFVVMPIGCGTCVTEATSVSDLPDDVPQPITRIRSGADLLAAIESLP